MKFFNKRGEEIEPTILWDDDNDDLPEEGEIETYVNSLGLEITREFRDGDWCDSWEDPLWDYVLDEEGYRVHCPVCSDCLRYNDSGAIVCLGCENTFSEQEIIDHAGPLH